MATDVVKPEAGGAVYAQYIGDQVEAQDRYQESIERRAMSVITSSSTVGALLFAFAALLRSDALRAGLTPMAGVSLAVSLGLFALAAGVAIFVNAPRAYEGPAADALQEALDEAWTTEQTSEHARHRVAGTHVKVLRTAKKQNARKARALLVAIGCESAAIAALAVGVVAAFLRW